MARIVFVALLLGGSVACGESPASAGAAAPADCPHCPEWTVPQRPFEVYGNTYYVGTHGLSSILVTSAAGHILIDGAVAEAAPQIEASIRALGFRVEDIRVILNSHAHSDHAGGLAALQRASGAEVLAGPSSAQVLEEGRSGPDDPQYGSLPRGPEPVRRIRVIKDGEIVTVGDLRLTGHFTPGHTPGGTSWAWQSCARGRCLQIVYADSLSAVSAPDFRFAHSARYPGVLTDFERSFTVLAALPCDILLTPHPEVSATFERLQRREAGLAPDAFVNPAACREYVTSARSGLKARLEQEKRAQR